MTDPPQPLDSMEDATAVMGGDARTAASPTTADSLDEQMQAEERARWTVLAAAALALFGVAAFGSGAAAVFVTDNEAGAAALLFGGTVLVVLGGFGHRLKTLRYKDLAFELYEEAHAAARRGDVARARLLSHAADIVSGRAAQIADSYASRRSPGGRSDFCDEAG